MVVKLKQTTTVLEILAKKGAVKILEIVKEAPKRYHELKETCSSDKTLSERLKQLEESKLIETVSQKVGRRFFVHYKVSEKGRQVLEKIKEIS